VQAFRAISWLIFKWLFIAIGAILLLIGLSVSGYFAYVWYTHDRHVANIEPIIHIDKSVCTDEKFPLGVGFTNNSGKTLNRVEFALEARTKGRSTNLAQYHSYTSDFITKPGESWGGCYALPKLRESVDPKSVIWSIGSATYSFAK
jgi:hypothetical protein